MTGERSLLHSVLRNSLALTVGRVLVGLARLVIAAIIQCWVWLAVEADRVDDKCRGKHVH